MFKCLNASQLPEIRKKLNEQGIPCLMPLKNTNNRWMKLNIECKSISINSQFIGTACSFPKWNIV